MSNLPPDESFASYLARRLISDKRMQPGVPAEAAELAEQCDAALVHAEFGFAMHFILDRQRGDTERWFTWSQRQLMELGRTCLKYTGSVNGTKLPVGFTLYEIGNGPPSEEDQRRLSALQRTFPGLAKVAIRCFYVDTTNQTIWTSAPVQRWFPRTGHLAWLQTLLTEPRNTDASAPVPDAVIPSKPSRPIATVGLLALLVALFVVEQLAMVGDGGGGLLGVNVGTLYALGAMNSDAVLNAGEWYRLLVACLLHADAMHLLFNGIALGLAGFLLESLLGSAWLIALFFIGALGGSTMGLLVNPANLVSVGASGAAMGLLSAALVASVRYPRGATRTQIQLRLFQFLIPSLIPLATHQQGNQVDFAAHFGGAIAGGIAGYALLRLWPSQDERPRFAKTVKVLGLGACVFVVIGLLMAKDHYDVYAEELSFSAADLLAADDQIPKDVAAAQHDVEIWGKAHPRDPRVHFFRALRLLEEEDSSAAEAELRAALSERQILERAFGDGVLETGIRAVLSELLLNQGRTDDAKQVAAPVCKGADGAVPEALRGLSVCD